MSKETELKYAVPAASWEALRRMDRIGGYLLDGSETVEIHDIYADTADRSINSHGFAFRIRSDGASRVACLKGLDGGDGVGHHRDEFECTIGSSNSAKQWPEGETKRRFLAITQGKEVRTEVEIHQTREKRLLRSPEEAVAEVSLDEVRVKTCGGEHVFFELEVEALSERLVDRFKSLNDELIALYDLSPVGSSKFERAMAIRARESATG